jgi:metal-dependent amidase/aminoacylase/carboxypeptidase family protein
MSPQTSAPADATLAGLGGLPPDLQTLHTHVHAHPEPSMQEQRTSDMAAKRLRAAGYDVTTGVGRTGVVGLLRNGDGPTVMLRADMDALPVQEATSLPHTSKVTTTDRDGKAVPVMHACRHDMHVTLLVGATTLLARARAAAKGRAAGRLGELATNHNPRFAPVMRPTLEPGVEALVVAAQAWLAA